LAEILGRHAAGVFKAMSGLEPDRLEIVEAVENEGPRYPIGVRVDFHGLDRGHKPWSGYFICAFPDLAASRDIAQAICDKLGLAGMVTEEIGSVDDVLGEFLNIVIGLTCSDWTDRGLETEFDPPASLSESQAAALGQGARAFHLTLGIEGHPPVSFFLVFSPQGEAAPA
jgi:hypothetical protein